MTEQPIPASPVEADLEFMKALREVDIAPHIGVLGGAEGLIAGILQYLRHGGELRT